MKSKWSIFALVLVNGLGAESWKFAESGFRFQFPRDHFNHSDYQTEWWYYTGNVRAQDGHRLGFEFTFFRSALPIMAGARETALVWRPEQIYLAHVAFSDLDSREFYHDERVNRAGPGLAGIDEARQRYWNGNWQVQWTGADQELQAVTDEMTLSLKLHPLKPAVIHGQNGVSIKGPLPGEASHYISFPRLSAAGRIRFHGKTFDVLGTAWMDHEFFTETSDSGLAGWDWFSVQLNNGEELMLYRIRRKDSEVGRFSSGTYVNRDGAAHFLDGAEFALRAVRWWRGYPVDWEIVVSKLGLTLQEHAVLDNQELISRTGTTPSYWEGAVSYSGALKGKPISGVGYLEMTGYGHPVWLGAK